MIDAAKLEARCEELNAIGRRVAQDIIRLSEAGITADSPLQGAIEREVGRISDEQIAVSELLHAVGTGAEEAEERYQDRWLRSTRLREALGAVSAAGIALDSPIYTMLEAELDRVSAELHEADEARVAARQKLVGDYRG